MWQKMRLEYFRLLLGMVPFACAFLKFDFVQEAQRFDAFSPSDFNEWLYTVIFQNLRQKFIIYTLKWYLYKF